MRRYYKLTDENGYTHNTTKWGEGVTYTAHGAGIELCSEDVIHVYDHPLKAAMFNPVHADFGKPSLWECRVRKVVADDGLKVGVKQCTTMKQVPLPKITVNQRVRFAILVALKVYNDPGFVAWADNWLSGKDRTGAAARAAAEAAEAAWAAAGAAEAASRAAAEAAAGAAEAASRAAAWAAAGAAEAASRAAAWAARAGDIDFVALIKRAIREEQS